MSDRSAGRRRAADPRRRVIAPTTVLAVVLCLLAVGTGLLAGQPEPRVGAPAGPEQVPLTQATLACPTGLRASAAVSAATGTDGSAELSLGIGAEPTAVPPQATTSITETDPVVVRAAGDSAPGLLALRSGGPGLRAVACPEPRADQWFTGVAGDAEHSSVIEMTNPDDGPAVVDLTLLGDGGPVDAPGLRGVGIPAGGHVQVDLAEVVPRRDELALHVQVTRGRVATSVLDSYQPVGSGPASADWLPAQDAPALTNSLLGLADGPGRRVLVVANPGEAQVRVALQMLTETSLFVPADVEEIVVPPRSTARADVGALLTREIRDGALGLVLTSSAPVTATLTAMSGGDRSLTVPGTAFEQGSLLLPDGPSRLVLTPEADLTAATVHSWDAAGARLADGRLELTPGAGAGLDLAEGAARVRVLPDRGSVRGAVVTRTGAGAVVQPVRQDLLDNLVPEVRPGLP